MERRELLLVSKIIDFGLQGRLNFCSVVYKIFGEYGEKAVLYNESDWGFISNRFYKLVRRVSVVEVEKCLGILLDAFLDLGLKPFLFLVSMLIDKLGRKRLIKILDEHISNGFISVDMVKRSFLEINLDDNKSVVMYSKLFSIFYKYFDELTRVKIFSNLMSSNVPEALPWLNLVKIELLSDREIPVEIEKSLQVLLNSVERGFSLSNFLSSLINLRFLYLRSSNRWRKYIEENVSNISAKLELKYIRKVLDKNNFSDVLKLDSILWFLDIVAGKIKYDIVLPSILYLVDEEGYENLNFLANVITKSLIGNYEKFRREIYLLSRSKSWKLRLFSVFLASQLVKMGDFSSIGILVKLCRDKRSDVRVNAAMSLLESLEKIDEKLLGNIIFHVILSKRSSVIKRVTDFITNKKPNIDILWIKKILKQLERDPRTTAIECALNIINVYSDRLNIEFIIGILGKLLYFSRDRKNLANKIINMISEMLGRKSCSKEREKLIKILKNMGIDDVTLSDLQKDEVG